MHVYSILHSQVNLPCTQLCIPDPISHCSTVPIYLWSRDILFTDKSIAILRKLLIEIKNYEKYAFSFEAVKNVLNIL